MIETILVAGFQRTGKDTLFKKLVDINLPINDRQMNHINWEIYSEKHDQFTFHEHYVQKSFAHALKQETIETYNIPLLSDDLKDTPMFSVDGGIVSARDLYIRHGMMRRRQDKDYWAKILYDTLEPHVCNVITDWRFENEYDMITTKTACTTIRIFRANVEIPSHPNEHRIDQYDTDYLFISKCSDFKHCCEIFPQYKNFVHIKSI